MSDLIILSEISCSSYLHSIGVYPKEFYLSFEEFKNSSYYFNNATVVCILAGTCRFSKKVIGEYLTGLVVRAEDERDSGILSCHILSDSILPQCKSYFLYDSVPIKVTPYRFRKKAGAEIEDFWGTLDYSPSEQTEVILDSSYNDLEEQKAIIQNKEAQDVFKSKIIVPELY